VRRTILQNKSARLLFLLAGCGAPGAGTSAGTSGDAATGDGTGSGPASTPGSTSSTNGGSDPFPPGAQPAARRAVPRAGARYFIQTRPFRETVGSRRRQHACESFVRSTGERRDVLGHALHFERRANAAAHGAQNHQAPGHRPGQHALRLGRVLRGGVSRDARARDSTPRHRGGAATPGAASRSPRAMRLGTSVVAGRNRECEGSLA